MFSLKIIKSEKYNTAILPSFRQDDMKYLFALIVMCTLAITIYVAIPHQKKTEPPTGEEVAALPQNFSDITKSKTLTSSTQSPIANTNQETISQGTKKSSKDSSAPSSNQSIPATSKDTLPATPIILPYDSIAPSQVDPWRNLYGFLGISDGKRLSVGASAATTGGFAELAGSEGWRDYTFSIKPNFISGTSLALVARYVNEKNYVTCSFGLYGYVQIDSVVNGTTKKILEIKSYIPTIPYVYNVTYSIAVKGNQVQCLIDSQPFVATVSDISPVGGIGIKTYNKPLGSSLLNIDELHVVQQ